MTIINYLEQLEPTTQVKIFLYKNNYLQMIADTTADVLLQSTKQTFRTLKVISTGKGENKAVVTVIRGE